MRFGQVAKVIYDLECEFGHRFEGWFCSAALFEEQRAANQIACPECQSTHIRSAPVSNDAWQNRSSESANQLRPSPQNELKVATTFVISEQVMNALVRHTEDVGGNFAEEARRIYYEEVPIRAIRGKVSIEECEALQEEGIDIIALPSNPLDDDPI